MGVINHNAVIASTWCQEDVAKMKDWIAELTDEEQNLFLVGGPQTNSETTVVMIPDGSKEGWEQSDKGDALRARFIIELEKSKYEDGSNNWCWIEVGFGEFGQKVLQGNNKNCYGKEEYCGN